MPQVMTLSIEGGEQQTQEIQFLEDEQAETVDTFKNGITQVYNTGTVTLVSESAIVSGTGTKWNSNNPVVSIGMLILIKHNNINYPYLIKAVNSDNELVLAEAATFSATNTTYTLILLNPTAIVTPHVPWLPRMPILFIFCKIWTHG